MPELAQEYYTILTDVGGIAIANRQLANFPIDIKYLAVGDGGGNNYKPSPAMSQLKHECWRGEIISKCIDPDNPNVIMYQAIIPASVGGFFVREVSILDADGTTIQIGNFPESYKTIASSGATSEFPITMRCLFVSTKGFKLEIDPNTALASQQWVNRQLTAHDTLPDAHAAQFGSKSGIGHKHAAADITSGTLPITRGGTGAVDASAARTALEITPANIGAAAATHGTHVTYATTAPLIDGTATAGTAATVARGDHRHPVDASRAAASHTHAIDQITNLSAQLLEKANIDKTITWFTLPISSALRDTSVGEYMRDAGGIVSFFATISKVSDITPNEYICTLPIGFRPSKSLYYPCCASSGSNEQSWGTYFFVKTDGEIRFTAGLIPHGYNGNFIMLNSVFKAGL